MQSQLNDAVIMELPVHATKSFVVKSQSIEVFIFQISATLLFSSHGWMGQSIETSHLTICHGKEGSVTLTRSQLANGHVSEIMSD